MTIPNRVKLEVDIECGCFSLTYDLLKNPPWSLAVSYYQALMTDDRVVRAASQQYQRVKPM